MPFRDEQLNVLVLSRTASSGMSVTVEAVGVVNRRLHGDGTRATSGIRAAATGSGQPEWQFRGGQRKRRAAAQKRTNWVTCAVCW